MNFTLPSSHHYDTSLQLDMFKKLAGRDMTEYVARKVAESSDALRYDLRDDDTLNDDDIVGYCMYCGASVTKNDVCKVQAVTYTWVHKDRHVFEAYECWRSNTCTKYSSKATLHDKVLEFCGLTEEEYIERLRTEQPTVYEARKQAGYKGYV